MRLKTRFSLAALPTLIPLIVLLRAAPNRPPVTRPIATHWTLAGVPDGFADQDAVLWMALVPQFACVLIAAALVISLDRTVGRWSAASGFGILALVSSGAYLLWNAILSTATQPELGDRLGSPFLLLLWAIPWALIAFWIAARRIPVVVSPPPAEPGD